MQLIVLSHNRFIHVHNVCLVTLRSFVFWWLGPRHLRPGVQDGIPGHGTLLCTSPKSKQGGGTTLRSILKPKTAWILHRDDKPPRLTKASKISKCSQLNQAML